VPAKPAEADSRARFRVWAAAVMPGAIAIEVSRVAKAWARAEAAAAGRTAEEAGEQGAAAEHGVAAVVAAEVVGDAAPREIDHAKASHRLPAKA
jgi:hypothetical protein